MRTSELSITIDQLADALLKTNFKITAAAARLGCTRYLLKKYINTHLSELPSDLKDKLAVTQYSKKEFTEDELKLLLQSKSIKDISEEFHVTELSIFKHVFKFGLNYEMHDVLRSAELDVINEFDATFRLMLDSQDVTYATKMYTSIENEVLTFDYFIYSQDIAIIINRTSGSYLNPKIVDRLYDRGITVYQLFSYELEDLTFVSKFIQYIRYQLVDTVLDIYASECSVREVSTAQQQFFLNRYHLRGYTQSSECYGLFLDNELVALMSFASPRYSDNYHWELVRYASNPRYTIHGSSTKLFDYFCSRHPVTCKSVITYRDAAKFTSHFYDSLHFKLIKYTKPNYSYQMYGGTIKRYQAQKSKLSSILGSQFDPNVSEVRNMRRAGFDIIIDSLTAVYSREGVY